MKFLQAAKTTWTYVNTGKPVKYGIKVRVEGRKGWLNCSRGDEPLWFDDPSERDAYLKDFKAQNGL